MKKLVCITGLALAGLFPLTTNAQVTSPHLIPFQGRLTDADGGAIESGQYTIIFNLYDLPVGGTSVWSEVHTKVGVLNGMVNVFLGSITTLNGVEFSQVKHLGITIDTDNNTNTIEPEMIPRQMIIPAFHAKNSEKLANRDWSPLLVTGNDPLASQIKGSKLQDQGITSNKIATGAVTTDQLASGAVTSSKIEDDSIISADLSPGLKETLIPPGTIMAFAGPEAKIPDGWLPCDGSTRATGDFPDLFDAINYYWGGSGASFNLPDLRGRFLRGRDDGAGRDADIGARSRPGGAQAGSGVGEVGSYQDDAFQQHEHPLVRNLQINAGGNDNIDNGGKKYMALIGADNSDLSYKIKGQGLPSDTGRTGAADNGAGNETHPKNAYVNYIIKI